MRGRLPTSPPLAGAIVALVFCVATGQLQSGLDFCNKSPVSRGILLPSFWHNFIPSSKLFFLRGGTLGLDWRSRSIGFEVYMLWPKYPSWPGMQFPPLNWRSPSSFDRWGSSDLRSTTKPPMDVAVFFVWHVRVRFRNSFGPWQLSRCALHWVSASSTTQWQSSHPWSSPPSPPLARSSPLFIQFSAIPVSNLLVDHAYVCTMKRLCMRIPSAVSSSSILLASEWVCLCMCVHTRF